MRKNDRSTSNKRPSKSPKKVDKNEDVQQKLRKNRQKLVHTLDTYTLLIRSNNPIRCLQHNSVISIYCQTQGKLLCSNCIFNKNEHRFHKMQPIDKSHTLISDDIQKMQLIVMQQIDVIQKVKDAVLTNLQSQQYSLQKLMEELMQNYNNCHRLLQQNYLHSRNQLIAIMQNTRNKHQNVANELAALRHAYNVAALVKQIPILPNNIDQLLLYHHSLVYTINQQKKFDGNNWNIPTNVVKDRAQQEIEKINAICQQLTKNKS